VKDEKMEDESDILQIENFLDPNDFVKVEEVQLWENLRSQMENDETPYWKSEPEENERVDEKVSEDNSDVETDKESLFLTQCLLSEWVHEVHGYHAPQSLSPNPKNIKKALLGSYAELWRQAIIDELTQFDDRNIFGPAVQHGRAMGTNEAYI